MSHLSALLRKNWILWKRNCFCSTCELLVPILLIFALIGIRATVSKTNIAAQSFIVRDPAKNYSTPWLPQPIQMIDNTTIAAGIQSLIQQNISYQKLQSMSFDQQIISLRNESGVNSLVNLGLIPMMKDCFNNQVEDRNQRNGAVGLGPPGHPIVTKLTSIFQTYYNYQVINTFKDDTDIDVYVQDDNYGQNGGLVPLCFAVMLGQTQTTGLQNYSYSLRYNSSFIKDNIEIPSTEFESVDPIKLQNLKDNNRFYNIGALFVQHLIETMIIQEDSGQSVQINPIFSYVHQTDGVTDDFADFLKGAFGIYLVLPLMIIYLRLCYSLMYEKEKKLREGMKMMGLGNTSFYLSWIIQYALIYTFISIIATILLKISVFPHTNGFILFLNYWLFCLVCMAQAIFISVFFTRALFGLIVAIVWYLMMYLVISLVGNNSLVPNSTYWAASISSQAAFSFSFDVMVQFEAQGVGVSMNKVGTQIANYSVSIALTMHIINFFFYSILAIYLDLVFPNEWGKKKHPLFFIPYFNRPHQSPEDLQRAANQIEKQSTDPQRYEEVDEVLKDQETKNEVLKIEHLSKLYPNGKSAVKDLTLTMYSGQIYALLGHNGAGKTSTISMLTGLLDISVGKAQAYGLDIDTQVEEIRKFMGVCPQHDILFDEMTVKEHLEMFAQFKGMKSEDIPAAVRRIIEDVDLLEKTDYLAKNLSGGQRRRLSVGIAFIGNSKLIFLDEPTSGMDTSARRYIWEMLKNYKEDKIIVLTTHFMDEADFLGDRIGIMGEGKLICSGSSIFLKNQFGAGYNLTIVKEDTTADSEVILKHVLEYCPEAVVISKVSAEILIQLPMVALAKFPKLFEYIDANQNQLKIQSYGISITTLEEVFLKVAHLGAGHKQVGDYQKQENAEIEAVDDFDINSIRIRSQTQLFMNHTLALFIKRSRYFKRDLRSLCCEVFLPCVIVACGLALMTIQFISNPPACLEVPATLFGPEGDKYMYFTNQTNLIDFTQTIGMSLANTGNQMMDLATADQYYFQGIDDYRRTNLGWYYMLGATQTQINYMFFVNSVFRDGPIIVQNQMNQAIFRVVSNNSTKNILLTNKPFKRTQEELNANQTISGFLSALIFSIGMAFIPASVISYIVKEREINIKHQQLVSGVSVKAYWFSNWLMDIGKHIIPSIICSLLILAFSIDALTGNNYGAMWILFFLYGWSIIPFCYLFSFLFKQQGNAMLLSFFFHLFIGSICSLVVFILRIIPSTRTAAEGISYVLRIIPSFAFAYGIVNAASKSTYKKLYDWTYTPSVYSVDISGLDILYLGITGLIYVSLVFLVEHFEDNGQLQKLGSSEERIPYEPKILDADVENEGMLCEKYQPEDKAILVQGLRKVFMLGENRYKVAVDKVSFAIDNGEVFGLLGVNGAGKTTTFKILSGEIKPTSGQAYIAGKSVIHELEEARMNIGYCPQFDGLLDNLTVREHIELFSDVKGIPYVRKDELVNKKLKEMDLERFEHILSAELSGGNKRKLSVAIAMIGNPPIVFLDEPSTGMDPEARRFMWNVISRIATQRKQSTVILTTHSMEEAEALSTKIAIQVEGNLRCIGSVQHIKSKFGKGYEIEVKLEKPSRQEIAQVNSSMGVSSVRLNQEQTISILQKLKCGHLEAQLSMKGYGSHIYNDLRKPNGLSIDTLSEFIIGEGMGVIVMNFISQQLGNFEIIEHFQTFYRFRLTSAISCGKLFSAFETNKQTLKISQYSIKQASIEQIFNNFAVQQLESAGAQHIQMQMANPVQGEQEMQPLNK